MHMYITKYMCISILFIYGDMSLPLCVPSRVDESLASHQQAAQALPKPGAQFS